MSKEGDAIVKVLEKKFTEAVEAEEFLIASRLALTIVKIEDGLAADVLQGMLRKNKTIQQMFVSPEEKLTLDTFLGDDDDE